MRTQRIKADARSKFLADVMGIGRFPALQPRRSAGGDSSLNPEP